MSGQQEPKGILLFSCHIDKDSEQLSVTPLFPALCVSMSTPDPKVEQLT